MPSVIPPLWRADGIPTHRETVQPLASPPSQASPHNLPYLIRAGRLKGARRPPASRRRHLYHVQRSGLLWLLLWGLQRPHCSWQDPHILMRPPTPQHFPRQNAGSRRRGAKGSLMCQTPSCLGHTCGQLPGLGEARGPEERLPPPAPAELQPRTACGRCAGRGPGARGALVGGRRPWGLE